MQCRWPLKPLDSTICNRPQFLAKADHNQIIPNQEPIDLVEEIGDLLFVVSNLARHLKVDPEAALRAANGKFERRFRFIEQALREAGRPIENCSLDELDALWGEAKKQEKAALGC